MSELENARQTLKEQDEILKRLTEGALMYGSVVGADGEHLVVATNNATLRVAKFGTAKTGQYVLLAPDTMQIVAVSQRDSTGQLAHLVRKIAKKRWIVSVDGHDRAANIGHFIEEDQCRDGDIVVLDVSGSVVIEVLPKQRIEIAPEHTQVLWEEIGGLEDAKLELKEAIHYIRGGNRVFEAYRAKPPKGILFYGPPGCGKTMLGKAVASELDKDGTGAFMYVKSPEILNKYVGESEAHIRDIFRMARNYKDETGKTAVVFFDEADAILQERGSGVSSDVEKTIVPTFLTEMDGLDNSSALVILATNRPDTLDPAVIRDGRIDRRILIERPKPQQGARIFQINLASLPIEQGQTVETLSDIGVGGVYTQPAVVSGALIAGVVGRAKQHAIRRDMKTEKVTGISAEDMHQAVTEAMKEAV